MSSAKTGYWDGVEVRFTTNPMIRHEVGLEISTGKRVFYVTDPYHPALRWSDPYHDAAVKRHREATARLLACECCGKSGAPGTGWDPCPKCFRPRQGSVETTKGAGNGQPQG